MTLIRALPPLRPQPPRGDTCPPGHHRLQQLEMLAQTELVALQRRCAAAPTPATPADNELARLAWDLGLDASTLP